MISVAQRIAIKAFIVAALAVDDDGVALAGPTPVLPIVPATSIVWDGEDGPRIADGPRIVLSVVGADERATTEDIEQVETLDPIPTPPLPPYDLVTRYRDLLDVTIGIRAYGRRNPASPSFSQDADQILRRIWTRVHSNSLCTTLALAGVATNRRSSIITLPRIVRGIQWESSATFDLGVRVTILTAERPGWVEHASGSGTLDPLTSQTFDGNAAS